MELLRLKITLLCVTVSHSLFLFSLAAPIFFVVFDIVLLPIFCRIFSFDSSHYFVLSFVLSKYKIPFWVNEFVNTSVPILYCSFIECASFFVCQLHNSSALLNINEYMNYNNNVKKKKKKQKTEANTKKKTNSWVFVCCTGELVEASKSIHGV